MIPYFKILVLLILSSINIFASSDLKNYDLYQYSVNSNLVTIHLNKKLGFQNPYVIWNGPNSLVFQANSSTYDDDFIIKRMQSYHDLSFYKSYLQEIELMKILYHPNLVRLSACYCVFYPSNFYYYIITKNFGINLTSFNKKRILSPNSIKIVMAKLLSGLEHLHSVGLIHRDIKPQNIIIDDELNVKIIDYGLTILKDDYNGIIHQKAYTADYRAPEVYALYDLIKLKGPKKIDTKSEIYDEKSDIFALGLVFLELLSRKKINFGLKEPEIAKNISRLNIETYFEMIESENGVIDFEVKELIEKMLDKNPNTRISAVQALEEPFLEDIVKSLPHIPAPSEEVRMLIEEKRKKIDALASFSEIREHTQKILATKF